MHRFVDIRDLWDLHKFKLLRIFVQQSSKTYNNQSFETSRFQILMTSRANQECDFWRRTDMGVPRARINNLLILVMHFNTTYFGIALTRYLNSIIF